jgi:hypothetical protein
LEWLKVGGCRSYLSLGFRIWRLKDAGWEVWIGILLDCEVRRVSIGRKKKDTPGIFY